MKSETAKRLLDVTIAALVLVLSAPLLLVALVALVTQVRAGSPLFRQTRIGRNGRQFTLYKLRTMHPASGSSITVAGDIRITRVGRALRSTKLDELPQLWNVLRGDMSLVGPRPDVPGYADRLSGDDRRVLAVRPGITSPAAVLLRHEEALLARADDPVWFNDRILYPAKTRLNCKYVDERSLLSDMVLLWQTIIPLGWQPKLHRRAVTLHDELLREAEQARHRRDRA